MPYSAPPSRAYTVLENYLVIQRSGIQYINGRMVLNTEIDFQRYGVQKCDIITDTFGILVTLNAFLYAI